MAIEIVSIDPTKFGPRNLAMMKAMEARQESPVPALSGASTQGDFRQLIPNAREVDKYDSTVQDQHAQDEARMKQLRFQGR